MFVLYGIVHWQIMFWTGPGAERPPAAVFTVLGHLWWLRVVFAALAVIWAIWSFRGSPKWAATVALIVSLVALMTIILIPGRIKIRPLFGTLPAVPSNGAHEKSGDESGIAWRRSANGWSIKPFLVLRFIHELTSLAMAIYSPS